MMQTKLQIGKHGLTPGFFESLDNAFKKHAYVKIHILKSAGHKKENVKKIAEEIMRRLGKKYTYKILGFTIFIKKLRKAKR